MAPKIDVKSLLQKFRKSKQIAVADVDRLRSAIADLAEDRRAIEAAPVPLAEAERRLDAFLDSAEEMASLSLSAFTSPQADWQRWAADAVINPEAKSFHGVAQRLFGLTVAVNRVGVRKHMLDQITDSYEDRNPLAEVDRAEQLAAIDAELLRLERAEEALVRASEEMGSPILRREDAAPAIVLSSDAELAA